MYYVLESLRRSQYQAVINARKISQVKNVMKLGVGDGVGDGVGGKSFMIILYNSSVNLANIGTMLRIS